MCFLFENVLFGDVAYKPYWRCRPINLIWRCLNVFFWGRKIKLSDRRRVWAARCALCDGSLSGRCFLVQHGRGLLWVPGALGRVLRRRDRVQSTALPPLHTSDRRLVSHLRHFVSRTLHPHTGSVACQSKVKDILSHFDRFLTENDMKHGQGRANVCVW